MLLLPCAALFSQNGFPASWAGEWAGKLEIFTATGKAQELPMELHILPLDSSGRYSFTIIYGEDKIAGVRPYELLSLDPAKGTWLLDEKNSIKMDAYLLGGKFFQWFEVEGSLLLTATELMGEELWWEIIFGSATPISITGGQKAGEEEISAVKTYPVKVLQRAKMRRG